MRAGRLEKGRWRTLEAGQPFDLQVACSLEEVFERDSLHCHFAQVDVLCGKTQLAVSKPEKRLLSGTKADFFTAQEPAAIKIEISTVPVHVHKI
jgi:hypothetical protein